MEAKIEKKSWEEFRSTGLLLFINQFLQIFGWSIFLEVEDTSEECKVVNVYPAKTNFKGFSTQMTDDAYKRVTNYMSENMEDIKKDMTL